MHFVQLLVHLDQSVVYKGFKMLRFAFCNTDGCTNFLVKLLYDEAKLVNLKLLIFNLPVFVLYLTVCNVQFRLQLFKFSDADNILTNFYQLELKLLVLDRLVAEIIAQALDLRLHLINLSFLRLSLFFEFTFTLL